jgi:ABC-2 type transport system ATP-binding protein
MAAIEITGLTKDYLKGFWKKQPFRALDDLDLEVEAGEIFGLLGPNGAGKTTTLKLLMRLTYPTAGSARLLGKPISDVEIHHRIGYQPEAPYFYDYLTAREFLDYCGQLFGINKAERNQRVDNLLEQVGMTTAADRALRHFSRGMLQRIGVAQALINDPDLVFLDEPMLGLDPVGRFEVRRIILELRERGKTVCFSTHILSDVESLCDRVAILNQGKLHGLGQLDEILPLKTSEMEVVVATASPALLAAAKALAGGVREAGDKVAFQVDPARLHDLIDIVRTHRGQVLSVNPVRPSLEDYFFETFGTQKQPEVAS